MNTEKLIKEARDILSLLARMAVSRATIERESELALLRFDADGWEILQIDRVRDEIKRAVKKVYGLEVRFD